MSGHNHGSDSSDSTGMFFTWSTNPGTLWFRSFSTTDGTSYGCLWAATFIVAVATVLLRKLKIQFTKWYASPSTGVRVSAVTCSSLWQTLILFLDYLLMLAAMTYNAGLLIAVLSGALTATFAMNLHKALHGGPREDTESLAGCCQVVSQG